ncbi:MAG TPA: FAD-dependent monooxygenase [Thermoleophilaceae bacterium]|nr:FAD-dependent monooxygenase [Thermoleophilaceae bacterium]
MRDLRVIVVGGGIGGLAAGIALRRAGFSVEIYERAPEIQPVGFAVCLWPNGAKAMDSLGLGAAMDAVSPHLSAMRLLDTQGEPIAHMPVDGLVERTGHRPYPVTRAELLDVLIQCFGAGHLHLASECVGVEQDDDGVTAVFSDGRRVEGDLLVAADGARSHVRSTLTGDVPLATIAAGWETLLPIDEDISRPDEFTMWIGASRRAATMVVSQRRFYTFFDVPPADDHGIGVADPRETLRGEFEDFGDSVQRLISMLDPALVTPLLYQDFEGLESFVFGRVVLLGDAAHATTPYLGQGAAQAIEDGIVLAHHLQTIDTGLPVALARYDAERRSRTQEIVQGARATAERVVGAHEDAASWRESLRTSGWDFFERLEQISREGPLR